jgi:hypothetical protein
MKRNNMKRTTILMGVLAFLTAVALYAADDHGRSGGNGGGSGRQSMSHSSMSRPMSARQPMTIHMNHTSSSGSFRAGQPSYGQIHWNHTTSQRSAVPAQRVQATRQFNTAHVAGVRNANVIHHHAYQQGYIRQKLSKIGVKSEPSHITDRSEMITTDRAHSAINYPRTGPKGEAIRGTLVSARQFNNPGVRAQMSVVNGAAFTAQIGRENASETQRGQTYWHNGNGFNYAHYIDNSGYHWYGFYSGNQYFWTRNYAGRWWWYDSGFNRWCFYNNNYWWWQDPYHVGDLYCYDDNDYVDANSADDQIVVTGAEEANETTYSSPDGTRMVKVVQSDGDAFLYDAAAVPSFDPIYLASGVQSIQYSDASNGRPLEIVVKLNDGSFDIFDAQGNPYNSETSENN